MNLTNFIQSKRIYLKISLFKKKSFNIKYIFIEICCQRSLLTGVQFRNASGQGLLILLDYIHGLMAIIYQYRVTIYLLDCLEADEQLVSFTFHRSD